VTRSALNLELEDHQVEFARSLRAFCRSQTPPMPSSQDAAPQSFPREFWRSLAELGVFSMTTPEGGGGTLDVVTAMEALGSSISPGPLPSTFLAVACVPPELRDGVASADLIATAGECALYPWATAADVFIEIDGEQVFLVEPMHIDPVDTIGREPWGRLAVTRTSELEGAHDAIAVADLAIAAYLVGVAVEVIGIATEHAKGRTQFGRPIGRFQAVAHPLARAHCGVLGARDLTRVAAYNTDHGVELGATPAIARLAATDAALQAAYTGHQVMGALGYTEEAGLARYSRAIRHYASLPPSIDHARERVAAGLLRSPVADTNTCPSASAPPGAE
jgi:alkylation response protein AidB-like acyl-CoA dehydrogenase